MQSGSVSASRLVASLETPPEEFARCPHGVPVYESCPKCLLKRTLENLWEEIREGDLLAVYVDELVVTADALAAEIAKLEDQVAQLRDEKHRMANQLAAVKMASELLWEDLAKVKRNASLIKEVTL